LWRPGEKGAIYCEAFSDRGARMGIEQVVCAPRSQWQNPHSETFIASIRRECLDHVIILNERHLTRILRSYLDYHLKARTHLSLHGNVPIQREVEPPSKGRIVAIPQVGGLNHRYRRAS